MIEIASAKDRQHYRSCTRPLARGDMPNVLAIEREAFAVPWTEEDFIASLRQQYSTALVVECRWLGDAGVAQIAAYAIITVQLPRVDSPKRIWLENLAVARSWRRQRVASAIVQRLIRQLSPAMPEILTQVRETNLPAQLFLKAQGFKATDVLRAFYDSEDAFIFTYRLRQQGAG